MFMNRNVKRIKDEYGLDPLKDVFFKHDHHVSFFIDYSEEMWTIRVLSGDPTLLGLPKKNIMEAKEIAACIETDNALSEVEGREMFLSDLKDKILSMTDDLQVHVPIKRDSDTSLWLLIGMQTIPGKDLVFGRVIKTYDTVPKSILHYQFTYQDSLTSLFTRQTLKKHIDYMEDETTGAYGFYLDLDHFKQINDRFGHQTGDLFLKDLASQFIDNWEHNVLYYRLGGDEFFVYVYDYTEEEAFNKAEQIIKTIESLAYERLGMFVSASIGIVPITADNRSYHTLLDQSDKAMYISKKRGNGNVSLLSGNAIKHRDEEGRLVTSENHTIQSRKKANDESVY